LSLCYFNLKDDARSKDHLTRLINLIGLDGLSGLAMDDQDRRYLAQIAVYYKLDKPAGEQSLPARTDIFDSSRPAVPGQKPVTPADRLKALEAAVGAQPKNGRAYLDLYEFHLQQKSVRAARRALQDMVKNVPADPVGFVLLGKMRFADKEYKEAAEYLEKALTLKKEAPVGDKESAEVLTYLILSYNALSKKPLMDRSCRNFLARSAPENVLTYDLTEKDKNLVISILDRFVKTPAAAGPAVPAEPGPGPVPTSAPPKAGPVPDASAIQKEIKKNPQDSSLYYGLYDLYRQKKDRSAARQTLEKLLKNNPSEAKGYLLLGKLNYEDKSYEDASEVLIKIFGLPASVSVAENIRSEAAFFLALSAYLDTNKSQAFEIYNLYLPLIQKFLFSGTQIADSDIVAWQNLRLAAEAAPQVVLLAIRPEKTESSLTVYIDLSKPTTYRTYILTREKSIVIELFQMAGSKAPSLVQINARGVKAVRTSLLPKDTVRVVVEGQLQIPSHRILKTETGLSIIIE